MLAVHTVEAWQRKTPVNRVHKPCNLNVTASLRTLKHSLYYGPWYPEGFSLALAKFLSVPQFSKRLTLLLHKIFLGHFLPYSWAYFTINIHTDLLYGFVRSDVEACP